MAGSRCFTAASRKTASSPPRWHCRARRRRSRTRSAAASSAPRPASTLLLLDAGPPPPRALPRGHDRSAHAGLLAFELGASAQRLVVNCGAYYGRDAGWRAAGRMTAAHSTLTVGDRNAAELRPDGGIRRGPAEMTLDRQEEQGAVWIAASHDGYLARFGILHRRRLFFAADGADLRGEDRIAPAPGRRIPRKTLGTPFAIRFHLHPGLAVGDAERDPDGIVAVPFASAESGPWHLVAGSRLAATVEESFYLGRGGPPKRTRQIVLTGTIDDETGIDARWAIKRMR
ncbi:MAG: heparinase II/III-family protein [Alphaproteobacteria bacterium]